MLGFPYYINCNNAMRTTMFQLSGGQEQGSSKEFRVSLEVIYRAAFEGSIGVVL